MLIEVFLGAFYKADSLTYVYHADLIEVFFGALYKADTLLTHFYLARPLI